MSEKMVRVVGKVNAIMGGHPLSQMATEIELPISDLIKVLADEGYQIWKVGDGVGPELSKPSQSYEGTTTLELKELSKEEVIKALNMLKSTANYTVIKAINQAIQIICVKEPKPSQSHEELPKELITAPFEIAGVATITYAVNQLIRCVAELQALTFGGKKA